MNNQNLLNPLNILERNVKVCPEKDAYTYKEYTYSYLKFYKLIVNQASLLKDAGVSKGSRVAIFSDNDLAVTVSLFSIWFLGATAIPLNVSLNFDKIYAIINIISPTYVVSDESLPDHIFCETKQININLNPDVNIILERTPVGLADEAIVMFTSGTSGTPKAVPMTFKSLGHNSAETSKFLGISQTDKLLINSPPYFTSAIIHVLTMFFGRGSIVVDRSLLMGDQLLQILNTNKCTGFGGVPTHFIRIVGALKSPRVIPESLRFFMNSGEHLPKPILDSFIKRAPSVEFFCVYGLTEVAGRLCILPPSLVSRKAGSVGFPLPGFQVSIYDHNGKLLPTGEVGQIFVTGDTVVKEYLHNKIASGKAITSLGLATGDYGYKDEDGCLYLEGRKDDIIKVGGEKVSLKAIEEAALEFPHIADVIAVPSFNDLMGCVSGLYYVSEENSEFSKKELLRHLRSKLSPTQMPAFLEKVQDIPRNASGKKNRFFAKNCNSL